MVFAFLFHWLGPNLRQEGTSWWRIFHLLLILPLTCMFVAALIGAAVDQRSVSWKGIKQRLRLSAPSATAWLWAAALSGFMYGGNWADLLAVTASWLALWKEKTAQKWMFGAILIGLLVKRYASLFQPTLESIRFFDPSAFHREFFSHFGPRDFMGMPLRGDWWILIYYAVLILVCNIGGKSFGGAAMSCHAKSWRSEAAHGLFMASVGQSSICSCNRLSGTPLAWQSRVWRFRLLHNAQGAHGRASSATVSAI